MTRLSVSGSREFYTGDFVDPKIASYVFYPCEYCGNKFQLVQPDNDFAAGGAIRKSRYRNPDTNEVKAVENRAQGVCLQCASEIMRAQQG